MSWFKDIDLEDVFYATILLIAGIVFYWWFADFMVEVGKETCAKYF